MTAKLVGPRRSDPRGCDTIVEALAGAEGVEERGFTFVRDDGTERRLSFDALRGRAARVAAQLHARGYEPGDRLVLVLPDNETFVSIFLGAIWAGVVPVPVFPPVAMKELDGYLDHVTHIAVAAEAAGLVTDGTVQKILGGLLSRSRELREVFVADALLEGRSEAPAAEVGPESLCFIQFTSGSTSAPKGVRVTHGNLVENAHCIGVEGVQLRDDDVGVSWLPLYHDMGLIGFVLTPVVYHVPIVSMAPTTFLRRPQRWLEAMSHYRGTISFAPNFAYGMATRRIRDRHLEGLDLSCWRIAGCGAEPIRRATLDGFSERFAGAGFRREAFLPVYGLAEATLAVTFPPLERGVHSDRVDADTLGLDQRVAQADGSTRSSRTTEVVACGRPFSQHAVMIADTEGRPKQEREVGEILVAGPSLSPGYDGAPNATRSARHGEWLRTGDLGYVADGELHVCGRLKEMIIVGGRNYYPHDVEESVWDVEGVRTGNAIAFALSGREGEDLGVAVEARGESPDREAIARAVRSRVADRVGITPREVVVLTAGSLPKTSSGKLKRRRTAQLYEAGQLRDAPAEARPLDLLRHLAASKLGYARSFLARWAPSRLARRSDRAYRATSG